MSSSSHTGQQPPTLACLVTRRWRRCQQALPSQTAMLQGAAGPRPLSTAAPHLVQLPLLQQGVDQRVGLLYGAHNHACRASERAQHMVVN